MIGPGLFFPLLVLLLNFPEVFYPVLLLALLHQVILYRFVSLVGLFALLFHFNPVHLGYEVTNLVQIVSDFIEYFVIAYYLMSILVILQPRLYLVLNLLIVFADHFLTVHSSHYLF